MLKVLNGEHSSPPLPNKAAIKARGFYSLHRWSRTSSRHFCAIGTDRGRENKCRRLRRVSDGGGRVCRKIPRPVVDNPSLTGQSRASKRSIANRTLTGMVFLGPVRERMARGRETIEDVEGIRLTGTTGGDRVSSLRPSRQEIVAAVAIEADNRGGAVERFCRTRPVPRLDGCLG